MYFKTSYVEVYLLLLTTWTWKYFNFKTSYVEVYPDSVLSWLPPVSFQNILC